jgi:transcriptional regulator with XRE-family HTH domain
MPVGDKIKELRMKTGESLQQVADAIGASKAHVWELEGNRSKNPSLDMLQKLATHFKTTVAYLIEEPEPDLSRAQQFFRRNSDKLADFEDRDFAALEHLLNMVAKNK